VTSEKLILINIKSTLSEVEVWFWIKLSSFNSLKMTEE